MAVDPTGKFAYVANERVNTVSAYSIGANGALTPVPGSALPSGVLSRLSGRGSNGQVRLRGKHVGSRSDVGVYRIADGGADAGRRSALRSGERAPSVAVDPTGKFAYVANQ